MLRFRLDKDLEDIVSDGLLKKMVGHQRGRQRRERSLAFSVPIWE
jgi:hypothetical protein